jgi:predicted nuclease with TOPRIM domain
MNEARVDRIEEALGAVGEKVDRVDAKIDTAAATIRAETQSGFVDMHEFTRFVVQRSEDTLRDEMRQGFAQVDQRFAQVDQRFAQMDQRFAQMDQRFDHVDARFNAIERRFDRLEERLFRDR